MRYAALLLFGLLAATNLGCRACCGGCEDYGPPVANCQCQSCSGGSGRAGSVFAQNTPPSAETTAVASAPESTK